MTELYSRVMKFAPGSIWESLKYYVVYLLMRGNALKWMWYRWMAMDITCWARFDWGLWLISRRFKENYAFLARGMVNRSQHSSSRVGIFDHAWSNQMEVMFQPSDAHSLQGVCQLSQQFWRLCGSYQKINLVQEGRNSIGSILPTVKKL